MQKATGLKANARYQIRCKHREVQYYRNARVARMASGGMGAPLKVGILEKYTGKGPKHDG